MLYLIIPPAIIIVSLALLIFFISHKFSNFSNEDKLKLFERRKIHHAVKLNRFSSLKVSALALSFLEIVTQWFKVLFLKFHNFADKCFRSIKEKKIKNFPNSENSLFSGEKVSKKIIPFRFFPRKKVKKEIKQIKKMADVDNRPMISKEVAQPEDFSSSSEIKDKLEETLIERIAINPRDIEAYERLGDYYFEQKNFEDARECYEQVLKLSPINYKVQIKLRKLKIFLKS